MEKKNLEKKKKINPENLKQMVGHVSQLPGVHVFLVRRLKKKPGLFSVTGKKNHHTLPLYYWGKTPTFGEKTRLLSVGKRLLSVGKTPTFGEKPRLLSVGKTPTFCGKKTRLNLLLQKKCAHVLFAEKNSILSVSGKKPTFCY